MKKLILVALLAVVMVPLASAGDIDILFAGGSWSWPGGVGSQLFVASSSTQINGLPAVFPIGILSGPAIGGSGSLFDPFTWAAGGAIVFAPGLCGGNDCFSGTFTALQAGFNGFGGMTFVGSFLSGTVDPLLLAALGLPPTPTTFTGLIHIDVSPTPASFAEGGRGVVGSGDLHITPIPEPGTLAMFGSGLIGLAGLLRRKLNL